MPSGRLLKRLKASREGGAGFFHSSGVVGGQEATGMSWKKGASWL